MLTEDEARHLLDLAGRTVEVDPAGPIEVPPRRRAWPVLAAAAAVTAIIVGGLAASLGGEHHDPPTPSRSPQVGVVESPDDGTVPSVLGYDADQAQALLIQRGYDVRVVPVSTCSPSGEALGTVPAAGTARERGAGVDLRVTLNAPGYKGLNCQDPLGFELLRFARGLGPAPAFADEVEVYSGAVHRTLTAQQAGNAVTWGGCRGVDSVCDSPLAALVQAADTPEPGGQSTFLTSSVEPFPGVRVCSRHAPPALAQRAALFIGVTHQFDGNAGDFCPAPTVGVYRDDAGRIDAVTIDSERLGDPTSLAAQRLIDLASGSRESLEQDADVVVYDGRMPAREVAGRAPLADWAGALEALATAAGRTGQGVRLVDAFPEACRTSGPRIPDGYSTTTIVDSGSATTCGTTFAIQVLVGPAGEITSVYVMGAKTPGDLSPDAASAPYTSQVHAFAAFARGGGAPEFADRVRLLLGNQPQRTLTAAEAREPANWSIDCTGYAERACPLSALTEVVRTGYTTSASTEFVQGNCGAVLGGLPSDLASDVDRSITLTAVADSCGETWHVQLWFDDRDRIYAANVVLGVP